MNIKTKNNLKRLGTKIQQVRKDKHITQNELAAFINKQRTAINRLESGSVNPSVYSLYGVAGGLGVTLEQLLKI